MSAQRLVGFVILVLGYLSGAVLVAQPFVPQIEASAITLLLLFAACLLLGLPLFAAGENRGMALRYCGWGLLFLGLVALVGIFVDASGLQRASSTLLLWFICPGALLLGLLLSYFAGALERLHDERVTGN